MKPTICLTIILLYFSTTHTHAQFSDSLQIAIGTTATIATQDYQPLWLTANRWGTIADRQADLSTHIWLYNTHLLNERRRKSRFVNYRPFPGRQRTALKLKRAHQQGWYLTYGIDLYNNQHFRHLFLEEAYMKLRYGNWELRGGRYEEVIGEVHPELSTGSLGISANAMPIPKAGIAVTDYTAVPFTNGWLAYKGLISHGWLGQERLIKQAFLHEKTFYLQMNTGRLKFFGGVQHFAVWDGEVGDGKADRNWKDFMDVLLVRPPGNNSDAGGGNYQIRQTDDRGVIEGGLEYKAEVVTYKLYQQTPFESRQNITPRNIDRLIGFSITPHGRRAFLQSFLLEFLHTRQMNSFSSLSHRESYYNSSMYKTGWEYLYRIIGTPLFINLDRGNKYFDTVERVDWQNTGPVNQISENIINNRVIALHTGASLWFSRHLQSKTLVTYTRNYGTYNNDVFKPSKDQWYLLHEFLYRFRNKLSFKAVVGVDSGELSDNIGASISLLYSVYDNPKNSMCKLFSQ